MAFYSSITFCGEVKIMCPNLPISTKLQSTIDGEWISNFSPYLEYKDDIKLNYMNEKFIYNLYKWYGMYSIKNKNNKSVTIGCCARVKEKIQVVCVERIVSAKRCKSIMKGKYFKCLH